MNRIGAQLYTVRELLTSERATASVLGEIKKIGYDSVQLYGGPDVMERCAKAARAADLDIVGTLSNLTTCQTFEGEIFAICKAYSIPDIGISARLAEFQQPADYIARVNAFAQKVTAAGFTFSYHNHGAEFIRLTDGKRAMDHFLEAFDSDTVCYMPDTYWLHDGGCDVRHFLEQTKNRVKILHLKDLNRTPEGHTFAEVGSGNLYFAGIIKIALESGITNFVVEQDICDTNPIESLQKSFVYVKGLLER